MGVNNADGSVEGEGVTNSEGVGSCTIDGVDENPIEGDIAGVNSSPVVTGVGTIEANRLGLGGTDGDGKGDGEGGSDGDGKGDKLTPGMVEIGVGRGSNDRS